MIHELHDMAGMNAIGPQWCPSGMPVSFRNQCYAEYIFWNVCFFFGKRYTYVSKKKKADAPVPGRVLHLSLLFLCILSIKNIHRIP